MDHQTANPADVQATTVRIISSNQPKVRRALEAELVFTHGHHPRTVTAVLQSLLESGDVTAYALDHPGKLKPTVYTTGREPTSKELRRLYRLYDRRDKWIPNWLIKEAGERYVRALFRASTRYGEVTQKSRLGTIIDKAGKNAGDVMVTATQSGQRFLISVKNQREILFPGHKAIKDCYAKAKGHRASPWLFIPFAVPEAMARCKSDGIRLTVLNRQIVPAEDPNNQQMWWVLRELQPIFGPQPFELLYARFDRTLQRSEASRRDLQMLDAGRDSLSA